ncbi:hypothetical protein KKE60_07355 [Patescibacteria group bacterium]|nr:hypothetical protein [Patescibacteria group bacterium]
MRDQTIGKYLEIVLQEVCKRVGAPCEGIDFKKDRWFEDYSWTMKEEESFTNWMVDLLYNNSSARRELTGHCGKNKKMCERAAQEFVFMYGWKYKADSK